MKQYLDLMKTVVETGHVANDRTGTGTVKIVGPQLRFDLAQGFPLVTTKKVHLRSIIWELLWFIQGSTSNTWLNERGVSIWDEWAVERDESVELKADVHEMIAAYASELGVSANELLAGINMDFRAAAAAGEVDGSDSTGYIERWLAARNVSGNKLQVAAKKGDLGPIYGAQWRSQVGVRHDAVTSSYKLVTVDQLAELIDGLKKRPDSRRHIVNSWNSAVLPDESISPQANVVQGRQALAPCHAMFQIVTVPIRTSDRIRMLLELRPELKDQLVESDMSEILDGHAIPSHRASLVLTQRSCDVPLGLPFNIASYALLLMMICQCVNMVPDELVMNLGDAHVYRNQLEGVREQLKRDPRPLPKMVLNPNVTTITDFRPEDFTLIGYDPHPTIAFPISV